MSTPPRIATGGKVGQGSLYVTRDIDSTFYSHLRQPGSWANIFGCRGMGKSSLYDAHVDALSQTYGTIVEVAPCFDFEDKIPTALDWFRNLARCIVNASESNYSHLESLLAFLPDSTPAIDALELLVKNGLLKQRSGNVLLILDEYDNLNTFDFGREIVGAFRRLHDKCARDFELRRLSVCFVALRRITYYATAGSAGSSSFALDFHMDDFPQSDQTVRELVKVFEEATCPNIDALRHVLDLSGGQPLITMKLLFYIKDRGVRTRDEVDRLACELVAPGGHGADFDHFNTIERTLLDLRSKAFRCLSAYLELITKGESADSREIDTPDRADLLLVHGLVRRRADGTLEPKGKLFRRRFDEDWSRRMLSDLTLKSELSLDQKSIFREHSDPRRRKRICIINAGGTLGMVERDGEVVRPKDEAEYRGYFKALDTIAESIEYVTLEQEYQFEPRDSINVFPDQWINLAEYICRRRKEVDGWVICHGTDTMAYTASALAFALGPELWFPVVFTGAQTTPDVVTGDAHINLYRACEVALQPIHEVVISFGNFVFRAVRAQKRDDRRFDGFESPTYPPLAEITGGDIAVRTELLRPMPSPNPERHLNLKAEFERKILMIPQYPGLDPDLFESIIDQGKCRGIILQTLGAGNVASQHPYSFIPFIDKAKRLGIPVIVTSQYPPDPGSYTKYGPATRPLEAGAIHAGNMTQAAAVVKFRWVLADLLSRPQWSALTSDDKKDLVASMMTAQSVVGEF